MLTSGSFPFLHVANDLDRLNELPFGVLGEIRRACAADWTVCVWYRLPGGGLREYPNELLLALAF